MTASEQKTLKRFYKDATVAEHDGAFQIHLDGRTIKTPAGRALAVPTRALADAIAGEWNEQGEIIAPHSLFLTRLANSAADAVAPREAEVVDEITSFAASDLLCYRAPFPAALAARQAELWNPVLAFIREKYGATFEVAEGVGHVAQPPASIEAIRNVVAAYGPFRLAALHMMTTLTGSALLALAHVDGFLDLAATWAAAHVDEAWQAAQWGQDFDAAERLKRRSDDFDKASRFFALA
ncbi:ATPase [Rhodomicrobium udaipurense JA643]|uniref:ATPase n=1 Tax=Rhodomicrobium udaipurense TaxID=1202716 RepID=A0A8I1KJ38_9HYPH|nr:ATP12 family protein [Rhodomicrobium udaipurense]KAI96300.1 ATPase [Rhodomicrobium udaipurense JA643]MBJ7542441.1 ATPase [Rhodomicrobium udaipurense]